MSCSKDKAINHLISQGWIKPTLDLTTSFPNENMLKAIEKMTDRAKDVYEVNMGNLFNMRFKDINLGNYVNLGQSSTLTKIKLEINEAAFEAIDRSAMQQENKRQQEIEENNRKQLLQDTFENETEGNFMISEEGNVIVPPNFPIINVKC